MLVTDTRAVITLSSVLINCLYRPKLLLLPCSFIILRTPFCPFTRATVLSYFPKSKYSFRLLISAMLSHHGRPLHVFLRLCSRRRGRPCPKWCSWVFPGPQKAEEDSCQDTSSLLPVYMARQHAKSAWCFLSTRPAKV